MRSPRTFASGADDGTPRRGGPDGALAQRERHPPTKIGHNRFMAFSCLVAAAGFALVAYGSWADRSITSAALIALPFLACAAIHVRLQRPMRRVPQNIHEKRNQPK